MPRTLSYTDEAITDLDAIRRWQIQPGSGVASIRRLKAIQRLKHAPCLSPIGDHPGVRELSCGSHRVMYSVEPDAGRNDSAGDVVVLRVFGPGQSREHL